MKNILKNPKKNAIIQLAFSAIGIVLSLYLWYVHTTSSDIVCSTGCDKVIASEYGVMFGIPVGALGVAFYLMYGFLQVLVARYKDEFTRNISNLWLMAGIIFTIYLRYLEFFKIGAICSWCWGSVVIILVLLGVELVGRRK